MSDQFDGTDGDDHSGFVLEVHAGVPELRRLLADSLRRPGGPEAYALLRDYRSWALRTVASDSASVERVLAALSTVVEAGEPRAIDCVWHGFLLGRAGDGPEAVTLDRMLPPPLRQAAGVSEEDVMATADRVGADPISPETVSSLCARRFLPLIAERLPSLRPIVVEHLEYYDEVLPHLLMGEVFRWAAATVGAEPDEIGRLVAELDRWFVTGDADLTNVIRLSFLDWLSVPEYRTSAIRVMLTPRLLMALDETETRRPVSPWWRRIFGRS